MTARFCKTQTDGFALQKVFSNKAYNSKWESSGGNLEEVKKILNQPFTYLSKGGQSYVFASMDGQYVIKLLRYDHIRPLPWVYLLPEKYAAPKIAKKEAKLEKELSSYKIAFDELREETGLLYIHLNKSDCFDQTLTLIDKLGISHHLNLDQVDFLVQKRARLVYPALSELISQGKVNKAKEALDSLIQLLSCRFEKEIFDKDPDLNTNFGFLQTKAIQLDVGTFRKTFPPNALKKRDAIRLITDNLHQWLMQKSPELDRYLRERVNEI